jgi:hypothetical protein
VRPSVVRLGVDGNEDENGFSRAFGKGFTQVAKLYQIRNARTSMAEAHRIKSEQEALEATRRIAEEQDSVKERL